jgi:large subunit ribosomal protein L31e
MAEEKILTINLRKEILKEPKWKRSKQAISTLKKILERHLKTKVKIGKDINELIWIRGGEKPLTKLRVKLVKVDNFYEARLMK